MYSPAAYTVEVRGGDEAEWQQISPVDLSAASLVRRKMEYTNIDRVFFEGSIRFFGSAYRLLSAYATSYEAIDIKVRRNGQAYWQGKLQLYGKWNRETHECELSATTVDSLSAFFDAWEDSVGRIGGNKDRLVKIEHHSIIKEKTVITYSATPPVSRNNWLHVETTGNGLYYHRFKKAIVVKVETPSGVFPPDGFIDDTENSVEDDNFPVYEGYWSKATGTQELFGFIKYGFYTLKEVFQTELDRLSLQTSIYLSDQFMALPDGLDYGNLFVASGELLSHSSSTHEVVPFPKPLEAQPVEFSMKDFCGMLAEYLNLYLCVEYIGGTPYLSLKHLSKVLPSEPDMASTNNISDFRGRDWSVLSYQVNKEAFTYRELFNTSDCQGVDFDGGSQLNQVTYPSIITYTKQKQKYDVSRLLTDFKHCFHEGMSGIFLAAVHPENNIFYSYVCKSKAGIHSGVKETNEEMSLSRVLRDYHVNAGRLIATGEIGNTAFVFSNTRKVNELDKVYVPARGMLFDFRSFVLTSLGMCELIEVVEYFDGRYSELKLRM